MKYDVVETGKAYRQAVAYRIAVGETCKDLSLRLKESTNAFQQAVTREDNARDAFLEAGAEGQLPR